MVAALLVKQSPDPVQSKCVLTVIAATHAEKAAMCCHKVEGREKSFTGIFLFPLMVGVVKESPLGICTQVTSMPLRIQGIITVC